MSHSELVLLSLLAEGPAHGYDLVKKISTMQIDRWTKVGESTLYMVLKRLQKRDFLTPNRSPGDRGGRKTIYTITPEGREHLAGLIKKGLSTPAGVFSDRLVASVFAAEAGLGEAIEGALVQTKRSQALLGEEKRKFQNDPAVQVILTFYQDLAKAEVQALRALQKLSLQNKPRTQETQ